MQRQTMPSCVPTSRQVMLKPHRPYFRAMMPKAVHILIQHCSWYACTDALRGHAAYWHHLQGALLATLDPPSARCECMHRKVTTIL